MELELQFGKKRGDGARGKQTDGTRRLLVLADLSGRSAATAGGPAAEGDPRAALAERPLLRVRQGGDGLDGAIAAIAPRLTLPMSVAGAARALEIATLDDFHPDALFRRLPVFHNPPRAAAPAGAVAVGESDADDVARLLGRRPSAAPAATPRTPAPSAVEDLIGKIIAGHVAAAPADAPLDAVALARVMRAVLHQPPFQALEASWRALDLLVSRADEEVEIWLLDLSKGELLADLLPDGADGATDSAKDDGSAALEASAIARHLRAPPGGRPFAALVGDFSFGPGAQDVALLSRLGALAQAAGAPFIGGAAPELVGCRSLAGAVDPARWEPLASDDARRWQAARRTGAAAWVGLALPRFLARAPYGPKTSAIDTFAFDELVEGGRPAPEQLCWANAAYLCALALARGALALTRGEEADVDEAGEIDDLPFFSFRSEGDVEMYPIAEAFWGQRAADAALARGLMPVLSARDRNAVRLVRLQSISDPPRALGGGDARDDD